MSRTFRERTTSDCGNLRVWTEVVVKDQRLWGSSRALTVTHNRVARTTRTLLSNLGTQSFDTENGEQLIKKAQKVQKTT